MTTSVADFLELRVVRRVRLIWWHGVLTFGLPVALLNLAAMSWRARTWPELWQIGTAAAVGSVVGAFSGTLRLDTLERRRSDGVRRCADCGHALPAHTSWCPATKSRVS
jgi:hypothetical protein